MRALALIVLGLTLAAFAAKKPAAKYNRKYNRPLPTVFADGAHHTVH